MTKKKKFFLFVLSLLAIAIFLLFRGRPKPGQEEAAREISPMTGVIQTFISTTGSVLPKNRLEIKPPVNGRLENILVKEGQDVRAGQNLAWMSSTERAALLDAARGQGEKQLAYWEDVYKPIALLSPIDGEVIVATTQPGQTVTTADAVVVLSDKLIVRAEVDETDIGKVKVDQKAVVSLDAYPDTRIKAAVEHIYYESKTVNNVTIYEVDLLPEDVPEFFRSGMNATINFVEQSRENALLIPLNAAHKDKEGDYVLLKGPGKEPLRRAVKLGISDDKNVEVISGVSPKDKIIEKVNKLSLPKNNNGSSPFTPFGGRRLGGSSRR